MDKVVHGQKYWTCKQTIESENYSEFSPHKPWQGILKGTSHYILYRFNEKDQIDDDTNASAYVKEKDLFETEEQALIEYRKRCKQFSDHLKEQYEYYLEESQC